MYTLDKLRIEKDLAPIVSAYKRGYKSIATKRFNKLVAAKDLKYWEMRVLQDIVAKLIRG